MARSEVTRDSTPSEVISALRNELGVLRSRQHELEEALAARQQDHQAKLAEINKRAEEAEARIPGLELQVAAGQFGLNVAAIEGGDVEAIMRVLAERQRQAEAEPPAAGVDRSRLSHGPPVAGNPPSTGDKMNDFIRNPNGRRL